ncbi:alpha/beta hydrolase [Sphingomonas sp. RRHST34]|uniref:Alpha/beta hydrolase n=1 Tax=Sphingomonas citri TaxID=2862499 RepID=A0ABS7BTG5_9SPHN|nr:alpha/beta hydrolase [Sphingomonas citri]MBW6532782.1 alpha/beta hydrolase [Sphingomonas citri]
MKHAVEFKSAGLSIAGLRYKPEEPNGRSLIIGHPGSSVKEQSPALYAEMLCALGFDVLTFDATHQGASEGEPRALEDPAQRVEDFKGAMSWLTSQAGVEASKIGALGICASGGYVIQAAAGDPRIRAVATVVAVDVGRQIRVGADGQQEPGVLKALLEHAAEARTKSFDGREIDHLPIFPENESVARSSDTHTFEGWDYYCTSRASHPRSAKSLTWDSIDRMATFDAFHFAHLIAPRPLLFITGDRAVTAWMTSEAFERAGEPKHLHTVKGASHVDLYDQRDYVSDAVKRISAFFIDAL